VERRNSAVRIATGYWLEDRGVGVKSPSGGKSFTSPCRPDQLWGPASLLSNRYWGPFPRGQSTSCVKVTNHLQIVSRSRKRRSVNPLPIRLHGVVLNYFSTRTNLPLPFHLGCDGNWFGRSVAKLRRDWKDKRWTELALNHVMGWTLLIFLYINPTKTIKINIIKIHNTLVLLYS
jgi:hypothetical protein